MFAETWAYGFKDPEGLAFNPQSGELWLLDHGPQGGDEINIVRPGQDYGWPNVTYGRQYDARQADGRKNVFVGTGKTSMENVEEPRYYWVPSIAPSGMMFYTGNLFPAWKGNLFVGAMAAQHLVRLVLDGGKCCGVISLSDIAQCEKPDRAGELLRKVTTREHRTAYA